MSCRVHVRMQRDALGDGMVHAFLHEAAMTRPVLHVLHIMRRFRWFFLRENKTCIQ